MLGLIALIIYLFFRFSPESVEQLYGQLFYPLYQYVRYYFTKYIPIPLIYILGVYLILWLIYKIIITPSIRKWKWLNTLRMTFSIVGFIIFFFYALWGYNYLRPTIPQRLEISMEKPDSAYITRTFEIVIDSLNSLRSQMEFSEGEDVCNIPVLTEPDSSALVKLRQYLSFFEYPNSFPPVIHNLKPKGLLLRWNTAGFFNPFTGEGYIDPGLPNIQKPYVIIHELCHAYGITQEGEANFLAYLACKESEDPVTRYSAYLSIYYYIASLARQMDKDYYAEVYETLDENVKQDFNRISECHKAYPSFMPKFRDFLYNSYLNVQGVEGGIKNYSHIIMLDYNWELYRKEHRFIRGIR